jgi:hypothetical protein
VTFPYIYVLCPELIHPLHCSPFYLSPLLMEISTVWMFHLCTCMESASAIFTFFTFFTYPASPLVPSPYTLVLRCLGVCLLFSGGFCLGILPVHALCLSQSSPLHCTSSPFSSYLVLFSGFQWVSLCLVPTQMWCLSLLFTVFLSFLSSSLGLLYQFSFWVPVLCVFVYIYTASVCVRSVFHIWEKTCGL